MQRDGRGTPGLYEPKHQPRLKLSDMIRRRKTTLKQMLADRGISTYGALTHWCNRIGVVPPTEAEFKAVMPVPVNSPQEGVIVLEAPLFTEEQTGREIDPEAPVEQPGVAVLTDTPYAPYRQPSDDTDRPQKKQRKRDRE